MFIHLNIIVCSFIISLSFVSLFYLFITVFYFITLYLIITSFLLLKHNFLFNIKQFNITDSICYNFVLVYFMLSSLVLILSQIPRSLFTICLWCSIGQCQPLLLQTFILRFLVDYTYIYIFITNL